MAQKFIPHAKALLALGLPIIGSHLAQMALHVTDTMLLGRYGVSELAAVTLAGSAFFVLFILGAGFGQGVMPLVASALGRGEEVEVRRDVRMGLWLSLAYGVAIYPLFWVSESWLRGMGQTPDVARLGQEFLRIAGPGMVPALIVMTLKSYLSAMGRTQVVLWITIGAVGLNLAVGWVLIFGKFGLPEWGVQGAAIATLTVQCFSAAALALYAHRQPNLRQHQIFRRFWRMDAAALLRVFRLGWPIGVTGLAESGLFSGASLMMGWISEVALAAHGIAMQVAALAFMVHLGLSNAATVLAGRAEGAGDARGLRDIATTSILMSFGFGAVMIVVFLAVPLPILSLFLDTTQPEAAGILHLGVVLLALAALFQLGDAMQVMALGLCRALHDTKVPMIMAAVSYWVVGIPCSYVLGFHFGLGAVGIWTGLVVGLAFASASLMVRFWREAPRPVPATAG
ncbi:MATE family efflux transporter [Rhodobacter sp. KR11]|uniref:MATE family efflux transporter n=1 Tax=Rhodobacter sp. KR11 TaxID=2974588 RepID=UPI00222263CC|nr:MATE family efflux transporter [Rhodobacter sp. KR11]MCW1919650.1 MATE family efflux transporter [Rhodobacter sp. KR11]